MDKSPSLRPKTRHEIKDSLVLMNGVWCYSIFMKTLAALLLALFTSAAVVSGEILFFHPKGVIHDLDDLSVKEDTLWYQPQDRKPYSESWYYLSVNEAGAVFLCHFTLAKINLFFEQYTVDFGIYLPDGTTHHFAKNYDKNDIVGATDRFYVKLGKNTLGGTLENQRLHIEEEDFIVDLSFTPEVPAFRDGDGRIYLDGGKQDYMDVTYQPSMRVQGNISIGSRMINWGGWGYADHVRQTFIPTDFASLLYAFRVKMGDLFITTLDYFPNPGIHPERLSSLIVAYKDRILHVGHDYRLEEIALHADPERGISVPKDFQLTEQTGAFKLSCTSTGEILQRVDLLGTIGSFKRSVLSFIGVSSFNYIFSEDVDCQLRSPEVSGSFSGKGVLEVVK